MIVQKELFGEGKHVEFKAEIPKKHEKFLPEPKFEEFGDGIKVTVYRALDASRNTIIDTGNETGDTVNAISTDIETDSTSMSPTTPP